MALVLLVLARLVECLVIRLVIGLVVIVLVLRPLLRLVMVRDLHVGVGLLRVMVPRSGILGVFRRDVMLGRLVFRLPTNLNLSNVPANTECSLDMCRATVVLCDRSLVTCFRRLLSLIRVVPW